MTLGIYIPTLGRPHKLQAVADNIKAATRSEYKLYWGVEPEDRESILAAKDTGHAVILNEYGPSYSHALQTIYEQTAEPVFFWGNDDFYFLDGWDEAPMRKLSERPDISVLGVHDGNPHTKYYSMSFVRRKYIEEQSGVIGMPNRVMYPYHHNFVDDELTETAKLRGVWDWCEGPCIEHQHPSFTWLGTYATDLTYAKNDRRFVEDMNTFRERSKLWA